MQHMKQQGRAVDRSLHARQAAGCLSQYTCKTLRIMWRSGLEFRYLLLGLGLLVLIEIGGVVDVGIAFLCSQLWTTLSTGDMNSCCLQDASQSNGSDVTLDCLLIYNRDLQVAVAAYNGTAAPSPRRSLPPLQTCTSSSTCRRMIWPRPNIPRP